MTPRPLHLTPEGRLDTALFDDARLRRVLKLLDRDGEEARLVGGAVRNALLGLPPGDIDIATTALPAVVLKRARRDKLRAIPTGIDHGTVTVVSGGLPVEVTTLREDIETDGRHAVVRFGRDFERDAERRDFTMNALSAGSDGRVHDTTGGLADLAAGRVRFIGDAATRIREDYLRILRFFRFHATFGIGPLDSEGLAAVRAGRGGIAGLSRERVRGETLKLLAAPGAVAVLTTLAREGLMEPILGGPGDVDRFARLAAFSHDDPVLRLAALAVRDTADVERLRDRLRLTNAERDRLLAALAALPDVAPDQGRLQALLFDHGREAASDALTLTAAGGTGSGEADRWSGARQWLAGTTIPPMPYTGRDLLERGLKGPAIGHVLARFRASYRDDGFPTDAGIRSALLDAAIADVFRS